MPGGMIAFLLFLVCGLIMGRSLLFLIRPAIEIETRIVDTVAPVPQNEGKLFRYYRCAVEYVVDGRTFRRMVVRYLKPEVGETVKMVYPKGFPAAAVEAGPKNVLGYVFGRFLEVLFNLLSLPS